VFSDSDLSAALSNPVVANSSGVFPSVYWDNVQAVRVRVREADGTVLGDADPYYSDGLSSTELSFLQSGTGAQTRTVQAKLRDTVSVKDFGAIGNGVADDTAAIQATIDAVGAVGGGSVFFPAGNYKTTDTLIVNKPNVELRGVGDGSLLLPSGDYGDVIHAYPLTGPNLQGFRVCDLYSYTVVDTTSGAVLHIDRCNGFRVDNCKLSAHYGGIHIDGAVHGYIAAAIQSDANFAVFRSGSYLFKATKGSDGKIPAEIHVDGADWRGQNGNYRLHYAVLIQCADGIWFDGPHFGFSKVGMALSPGSDTDECLSIVVRGGYLDTCQDNLLQAFRPSPTYSADWGLHSLDFATQYNSGSDGWNWFCESTGNNFWSTIQLGNMLQMGEHGVNVGLGKRLFFQPGWTIAAPSNNVAGKSGVVLQGTVSEVRLGTGTVLKGSSPNTPANGILITSAVDKFRIEAQNVIGCTNPIADNATTSDKVVGAAVTW
jgi:hypothetical protein